MKLSKINPSTPSFNGHAVVCLNKVAEDLRPVVTMNLLKEVGCGLFSKPVEHGSLSFKNDIFVGLIPYLPNKNTGKFDEIVFAMGNDTSLNFDKGKILTDKKLKQIDIPIWQKIEHVLSACGVGNLNEVLKKAYMDTGDIFKKNNSVFVEIKNKERSLLHCFTEENNFYTYQGTSCK